MNSVLYIFYFKKITIYMYIYSINSLLLITYTYECKSKMILMPWTKLHHFFLLDVHSIPPPPKKKDYIKQYNIILINQFKGFINKKFSLKTFKTVNMHAHVQTYISGSWTQFCQQQHISFLKIDNTRVQLNLRTCPIHWIPKNRKSTCKPCIMSFHWTLALS